MCILCRDSDIDGAPLDSDVDGMPLGEDIDGAPSTFIQ